MANKINEFIFTFDDKKRAIISCLRNVASDVSRGAREDINKKYVSVIFDRGSELSDPNGVSLYIYSDREPSEEFKQYHKKT